MKVLITLLLLCLCQVHHVLGLMPMNPAEFQVTDLFAPVMPDSPSAPATPSQTPDYAPAPPVANPPVVPSPPVVVDPIVPDASRAVGSVCRFTVDTAASSPHHCAVRGCSWFQGECLCRRNQHSCQNEPEAKKACIWEESANGLGLCKALIEKVYEKFDTLLSKRGKKDLSLNIRFKTDASSARFPFGPLFAGIYGAPTSYYGYQSGYGGSSPYGYGSMYGSNNYGSSYGGMYGSNDYGGYGSGYGGSGGMYGTNSYGDYGSGYGGMYGSNNYGGGNGGMHGSYSGGMYGSNNYGGGYGGMYGLNSYGGGYDGMYGPSNYGGGYGGMYGSNNMYS